MNKGVTPQQRACCLTRSEPGVSGDGVPRRRPGLDFAHQANAHQLQAPPASDHEVVLRD